MSRRSRNSTLNAPRFGRFGLRAAVAAATMLQLCATAAAQESGAIGVSAPISGFYAVVGKEIEKGARAAVNRFPDARIELHDDECEPEGGVKTAEEMIESRVRIAIGYPCIEAFDAAMPKLADANIPLLLIGVQSEAITVDRRKGNWPVLRLAPKASDEADAIADYLKEAWRGINFAIIDDGTLYGRQIAEEVRFRLEEDNLKPVFTDTYRPQLENQVALVRRLQKSGATHVFVGGDAFDAAIIGADAEAVGVSLTLAGGSAFVASPEDSVLADGTILGALPAWSGAGELPKALSDATEGATVIGNSYLVPTYAAMQIAMAALEGLDADEPIFFGDFLGRTFQTVLGPIRFDGDGNVSRNLFRIFVIEDGRPVAVSGDSSTGAIQ